VSHPSGNIQSSTAASLRIMSPLGPHDLLHVFCHQHRPTYTVMRYNAFPFGSLRSQIEVAKAYDPMDSGNQLRATGAAQKRAAQGRGERRTRSLVDIYEERIHDPVRLSALRKGCLAQVSTRLVILLLRPRHKCFPGAPEAQPPSASYLETRTGNTAT